MKQQRSSTQCRSAATTNTRSKGEAREGAGGASQRGEFTLLGQRFGSLQAVHDWVAAESATPGSTVPHEPVLRVGLTAGSLLTGVEQTTWNHYNPGQKLIIEGSGATVSGFRGSRPAPGFFLSYRPIIGEGSTATAPAAANFELRGLTIRGFESGGVEISPQTAAGKDHRYDGGETAFLSGAVISDNRFEDLGSLHSKNADWATQRYGVGGVLARGLQGSQITHNRFENLENGAVKGTPVGERLIHAVYLRDASSNNLVSDNTFAHVSGDPVRVSDASNDNRIEGNRSRDAGVATMVSEFYNPTAGEKDSTGNREKMQGNKVGSLYGRGKKAVPYKETVSRGKRPALAD